MNKNIDIRPRNDKGEKHGYWETYWHHPFTRLRRKSTYLNGVIVGYYEYHPHNETRGTIIRYIIL